MLGSHSKCSVNYAIDLARWDMHVPLAVSMTYGGFLNNEMVRGRLSDQEPYSITQ